MRGLALGAALWLCGCGAHFQQTLNIPKDPPQLTTVVVYPFGFRWPEPAYRSFELSQRLIEVGVAEAGDKLAFYGPTEFKVLRDRDNSGWVSTTALQLIMAANEKAEHAVMLRAWAERRITQSSSETYDTKGKPKGANSNDETLFIGHVEIIHPSSRDVLVEITGEAKTDPFADPVPEDDYDPAPLLTDLMSKLTVQALKTVASLSPSREVKPDPKVVVALAPGSSLAYQEEGRASATEQVQSMDPIAQELFVQNRAHMLAPFLTDTQLVKVAKNPAGLFVVSAPEGSKLQAGDVIVQIDSGASLPQHLYRLRFSTVPSQLSVLRGGQQTEIVFP